MAKINQIVANFLTNLLLKWYFMVYFQEILRLISVLNRKLAKVSFQFRKIVFYALSHLFLGISNDCYEETDLKL